MGHVGDGRCAIGVVMRRLCVALLRFCWMSTAIFCDQRSPVRPSPRPVQLRCIPNGPLRWMLYHNPPRPGLIYLDIEMPGMGGQDTLRAVRAMPEYRDTPIVSRWPRSELLTVNLVTLSSCHLVSSTAWSEGEC